MTWPKAKLIAAIAGPHTFTIDPPGHRYENITAGKAVDGWFQSATEEELIAVAGEFASQIDGLLRVDTNGFVGAPPAYTYARANPIDVCDANGRGTVAVGAGFGGAIAGGIGVGVGAAAGGAIAVGLCLASEDCRREAGCALKAISNYAKCAGKVLCTSDFKKGDQCYNRARNNYRACRNGWPDPHDPLWPGGTSG
jgi:hypothetical protein